MFQSVLLLRKQAFPPRYQYRLYRTQTELSCTVPTASRQLRGGGNAASERARQFLLMSLLKILATKRSNCK